MNHVNIITSLALLLLVISCKQEPSTSNIIDFKRTDNNVVVRIEGEVNNVLPLVSNSLYESQVFSQLYNYLVSHNPITNTFEPELIKTMPFLETNDDDAPGKYAYTFEIIEAANWSDGTPVTANDFLVTVKSTFNPLEERSIRYRPYWSDNIKDIVIDPNDPKKFKVYFDQLDIQSLEYITNTLPVIPAKLLDPGNVLASISLDNLINNPESLSDNDDLAAQVARFSDLSYLRAPENLISSGPYTVGEWVTGQKITLNRKKDWWGDQVSKETHGTLAAYPNQITYQTITDPAGAYAAIKSEDVDVANRILETGFESLQQDSLAGLKYDYLTVNAARVYFVAINTKKPKLAQKEVRQALAYAFDVDEVLETVYSGYGQRTASPVYPTVDIYNKEIEIKQQNIEKAKALLEQAGWEDTNGNGIVDKVLDGELTELSVQYIASPSPQSKNTALLFQSHAKLAGIDIQVDQQSVQDYFANYRSKNYDLISTGSTITPNWNPKQFWHSEGANRTGFASPETDELIDQIVLELDENKRAAMYKDLQAIIAEKQPVIFLHVPKTTIAIHKRFDYDTFEWYEGFEPRWFKLKDEYKGLSQN